jgi:hypothetical protein
MTKICYLLCVALLFLSGQLLAGEKEVALTIHQNDRTSIHVECERIEDTIEVGALVIGHIYKSHIQFPFSILDTQKVLSRSLKEEVERCQIKDFRLVDLPYYRVQELVQILNNNDYDVFLKEVILIKKK